jgi:hypothetical protein
MTTADLNATVAWLASNTGGGGNGGYFEGNTHEAGHAVTK